ncbi:Mitochondrial mRNA pseudouridine synthase RPUSD3 [Chionoecetes opilio]|uniref:Mitochondrial mRNA pseudouridine synthase RPUSD3 n=1 Tax=Chionoecetes opilio TaxID=41210 RepID=A0A8J8WN48_CHIOP|nr:Mitochondrial mRNA pseudouridine synthase RPUSD3 [Chionoecetes opilio]
MGRMFVCQRVTKLCPMGDCGRNLRFMATAATSVKTESSHKKHNKKDKKLAELHKKEKKLLRERLLMANQGTSNSHVYKKLYPWEASEELAEHLRSTQVFHEDGLIALSKPYGIAMEKVDRPRGAEPHSVVETVGGGGGGGANTPAMSQVLPTLKTLYGVDHLEIVKSTERWSSGLMLLSTCSKVTEKVQKCLRRSKTLSQPAMTYQAVTLGLPNPATANTKVATKLEYVHDLGNVPVIQKSYSRSAAAKGEVKPTVVQHRALVYSKEHDASLVELKAQVSKWHFLRVWLAYSYSPVLGDHLYARRVKTLAGRRIQVSPHNVTREPQVLPDTLYSTLALPLRSSELIPCHIHLSSVTLSQFNKDKSDLVLSAPPPEHFKWTCEQLGLEEGSEEENSSESSSRVASLVQSG